MKSKLFLTLLALAILSTPALSRAMDCGDVRETTEGPVKGLAVAGHEACSWKGIPYAAPPVGDLRWRAPQEPAKRDGVYLADHLGMACPQTESLTSGGEAAGFAEDCLTLNVWSPKKEGKFPVMVWIHGGAFRQGTGTYEMYNGARLAAERDVVVVTINYRLGALGFLALPQLRDEDSAAGVGNFGLLDQIQALKWVKSNIAALGGDPDNVTIFGQSAGGMSVSYLLVSPLASGLFHRAINMSGPLRLLNEVDNGFATGRELVKAQGCEGAADILECLRAKPAEAFVGDGSNVLFNLGIDFLPVKDGVVIPDDPIALIKAGKYNQVPLMAGCTKEELRMYTMSLMGLGLLTRGEVRALVRYAAGENADEILAMYDFEDYRRPVGIAFNILNDAIMAGPIHAQVKAVSEGGGKAYFYRFDWDETRMPNKMGSFHGLDIPFVFGALELDSRLAKMLTSKKAVEAGRPLSEAMMSYYANFARTGDPNGEGLVNWPQYGEPERFRLILDTPVSAEALTPREVERFNYFAGKSLEETFPGMFD